MEPPVIAPTSRDQAGSWLPALAVLLVVPVALAIFHLHVLRQLRAGDWSMLTEAMTGIIDGTPHWRLFQNRLIGPALHAGLQQMTHASPAAAYTAACGLLLAAFHLTLAGCVYQFSGRNASRTAVAGMVAFALTLPLMHSTWLYLWDLVDLTVFTLFGWLLLSGASARWLAALILVEAFNREVAAVMALALVVVGVICLRRNERTRGRALVVYGLALMIVAVAVAEWLRTELFIQEVGPARWNMASGRSFNFQLIGNVQNLLKFCSSPNVFDVPKWLLVLSVPIVFARAARNAEFQLAAIAFSVVWLSVAVLGVANEWRVWLAMIPLMVFILIGRPAPCENHPGASP